MNLDHYEGFEREALFHHVLAGALRDCPAMKAGTVREMIRMVAPQFMEGLFRRRPCRRILRYTGRRDAQGADLGGQEFFTVNQVYESLDFNGATYTLKGYKDGKGLIGFRHFQRVS